MPCWFMPHGLSVFVFLEHFVGGTRLRLPAFLVMAFLFQRIEIIFAAVRLAAKPLGVAKTSLAFRRWAMALVFAIPTWFFPFAETFTPVFFRKSGRGAAER